MQIREKNLKQRIYKKFCTCLFPDNKKCTLFAIDPTDVDILVWLKCRKKVTTGTMMFHNTHHTKCDLETKDLSRNP